MPNLAKECASSLSRALFPDDCRLCGQPLIKLSRVPVCAACLRLPEPIAADYFCVCCRTPFVNRFPLDDSGRCALCRTGAQGFDVAYSFGGYQDALRALIHLLKYERIRTLSRPLGELLAMAFPRDQRFDAIVPMPLHWRKQWQRGFNQSALLAEHLGRRLGLPVIRAVRRVRATSPQAGLTNSKRRANVAGAFAPHRRARVNGLRLLLVDDVMTTGATASACSRALKSGGARYVALLALARADRRFPAEGGRRQKAVDDATCR